MLALMSEGDENPNQPSQLASGDRACAQALAESWILPSDPACYLMKDRPRQDVYIAGRQSAQPRAPVFSRPASGDTRDFVPLLESG